MFRAVRFWEYATVAGPIAAFVLPPLIVAWCGGFGEVRWIGQPVTPWQGIAILGAMVFPIAAWAFARMRLDIALAQRSRSWPTVTGTLNAIDLEERHVFRTGTRQVLRVDYSYDVGGTRYRGERFAYAPRLLIQGHDLEQIAQRYRPQGPVTVHYNPAFPADAVLHTGDEFARQRWSVVMFGVGAPIILTIVIAFLNGN